MQLQVVKFHARSFDLDSIDLYWEINDFPGNINQFDFYIKRSESIAGPFEVLAGPFKDQFHFRDVTPALMHKWRDTFYVLQVVDVLTSESVDIGPTAQLGEPDLIALEIMRQEDVLFREHVGRRCWAYPVRTFGPRCVCFDRTTGRRTKSNCLNCYDTSYLGGFLSPIECFIQIDPYVNSPSLTPLGEHQNHETSARLISFPPLKPKDILIEAENKRWRIERVTPTQRLRAVVHQELVLHEISKGDIEYKLPVNVSTLLFDAAAERNFTNPQHVDSNGDIRDLLAVYSNKPRGSV